MEKLMPRDIQIDIFSRLPAETLVPCKRVCKTWRDVYLDKYFIDLHLRRNGGSQDDEDGHSFQMSFLILGGSCPNKSLYYGNYSDEKQHFTYKKLKNNHDFTPDSIVGSCKGLICFSTSHISNLPVNNDPVCVCNPITGEFLNLPKFVPEYHSDQKSVDIASGFGYAPLTDEYKVVRICFYKEKSIFSNWVPLQVHVHTLGSSEGWRKWKGDVDCLVLSDLIVSQGVCANGALYWLNIEEHADQLTMVAFDLTEEKFSYVEPPPCFHLDEPDCYQLLVLGGCLSVVHQRRGEYVDIWSLKKTNNDCNTSQIEEGSWSWTREFRIVWQGKWDSEYQPLAVTKKGQVLFWYNQTILCLYDAEDTCVTEVMNCDDLGIKDFQTIPHINSFVDFRKPLETAGIAEVELST